MVHVTEEVVMSIDAMTDPATYVATALGEVCFGNEETSPLEHTVDRYFTPDYEQYTDGALVDHEGFVEHIRALRALVVDGQIEVLEVVRDGSRIADRHQVTVTKRDGTVSQIEVYLFGTLAADGRLRQVHELSRVVTGSDGDADLARTR
jgi:hypothetical protein